ncbi:MAG TPA: endopeptidase La [Chondromyces sp.]|nr:endopeptidase La [Chondromyces sp.]
MTETPEIVATEPPETIAIPDVLPVLALRDTVLFPFAIIPLTIGREISVRAVDEAMSGDRLILTLTQRSPQNEAPAPDELYELGCVAQVMRMLKLPDGTARILIQGLTRAKVDYFSRTEPYYEARLTRIEEPAPGPSKLEAEAFVRSIRQGLERVSTMGKTISPEVLLIVTTLEDPLRLADLAASNLGLEVSDAQQVLETVDAMPRLRRVHELVERELALAEMQERLSSQVRGEIDRNQREFFLRQQLRAIQQELGEADELEREMVEYREKAAALGLSDEAREAVDRQLRRLATMHPDSAESSVVRTWLDWMTTLPWATVTEDNLDIKTARAILDEDHYNLEKVKQRILEFLAVRQLRPEGKGPILCFVGPPGVGKTSLGRSIARALGRRFVRSSLGGVRDEAEIRGHRRTYVGALPGRIIQGLVQAGSSNPVFMLDEVDKLGADVRGDPSSALLEVLDPEQNDSFRDHYLGVVYDLSKVLFIATGNLTETIQPAFLDRMEVIRLSGYTEEEKLEIARGHLLPRQIEEAGLAGRGLDFTGAAVRRLITGYTSESGLRNLEREIGSVCRKVAVQVAEGRRPARRITPATVERLLGPPRFLDERPLSADRIGVATGLAFTAVGGDILLVEAVPLAGKGGLELTGSLGEVMKESAAAALSLVKAQAGPLGIADDWFAGHSLHVHVPAGGIPKDGPSAGVTLLAAMVSAASGRAVRHDLAMTGEITLRGDVLAVGGVKEKVLAAIRAGIPEVLLPAANERDLVDIPKSARRKLKFRFVTTVDEVLEAALASRR